MGYVGSGLKKVIISQIQIENFQSHENTVLKLHPGINVVVGASDSGKSAIVRALRWLVWNKPGGDAFRSTWGGDTVVTLQLDTGSQVRRVRTSKINEYSIDNEVYHAFGSEPPEDVQKLLNFAEINLQQQLDRPFLLDNSPGQVAQYLNSVAHLDVIDRATSSINGWVRGLNTQLKHLEEQQSKFQERLEEFAYLPEMESDIQGLEKCERELSVLSETRAALFKALSAIEDIRDKLHSLSRLTALAGPVEAAITQYTSLAAQRKKLLALQSTLEELKELTTRLQRTQVLRSLRGKVERALSLLLQQGEREKRMATLLEAVRAIGDNATRIEKAKRQVKELKKQFHKEMGDVCILCGKAT